MDIIKIKLISCFYLELLNNFFLLLTVELKIQPRLTLTAIQKKNIETNINVFITKPILIRNGIVSKFKRLQGNPEEIPQSLSDYIPLSLKYFIAPG